MLEGFENEKLDIKIERKTVYIVRGTIN